MARYIDVEGYRKLFDEEYKKTRKLIFEGETHLDNLAEGFSEASRVIDRMPTADVVPKSEVEELEQDVTRLEQELTNMLVSEQTELHIPMEYVVRVRTEHPIYKAIKAEVAKEIFAEILNIIRGYSHSALVAKNNYGATQAEYIGIDILELKKKYTEGKK